MLELAGDYNLRFRRNVQRVMLAFIVPASTLLSVVEPKENDFNSLIGTFYISATLGYALPFFIETGITSAIRLGYSGYGNQKHLELYPLIIILP